MSPRNDLTDIEKWPFVKLNIYLIRICLVNDVTKRLKTTHWKDGWLTAIIFLIFMIQMYRCWCGFQYCTFRYAYCSSPKTSSQTRPSARNSFSRMRSKLMRIKASWLKWQKNGNGTGPDDFNIEQKNLRGTETRNSGESDFRHLQSVSVLAEARPKCSQWAVASRSEEWHGMRSNDTICLGDIAVGGRSAHLLVWVNPMVSKYISSGPSVSVCVCMNGDDMWCGSICKREKERKHKRN